MFDDVKSVTCDDDGIRLDTLLFNDGGIVKGRDDTVTVNIAVSIVENFSI